MLAMMMITMVLMVMMVMMTVRDDDDEDNKNIKINFMGIWFPTLIQPPSVGDYDEEGGI